jgi:fructooligosaccharide transport system substrate-binding protein
MAHALRLASLLTAVLTLILGGPAVRPTGLATLAGTAAGATAPGQPTGAATPTADLEPASAAKPAPARILAQAVPTAVKKLTFIGVQNPDQQAALTAVLVEYQKTHPNIDVEFELLPFAQLFPKIQANAAAKVATDIILADGPNVWNFAYHGVIAPMDEWFDEDYIKKNWLPTSLLTSQYRGKFYAPPQMESCSLMWYNQDLTDRAGIKPPTQLSQSWTMEQALEAWLKVNNPPQTYGVRWGQGATPGQDYEAGLFRRSAGPKGSPAYTGIAADGVTISGHFDHPDAVKGHQFFHDLYWKHKVSAVEGIPDAWWNQRAVFYVSPDNAIGTYNRLHPQGSFKYSVTGIPYFKGGTQICHSDSWHYALGANSRNRREAAEFIKFLSGPVGSRAFYQRLGQLPAHVELLNTLPEYQTMPRSLVAEQFKAAAQPRILTPGFTEYNSLMIEFVGNLVAGRNLDVKSLATTLARRADALMAKYKDWKTK